MKLTPIKNKILCRVKPSDDMHGVIHLPKNRERDRFDYGEVLRAEVIAVGPEVYDVQVGMTLLLCPANAEDWRFTFEGVDYVCIEERYYYGMGDGKASPLFGVCE